MKESETWFAADKEGLNQIVAGRPKAALLRELLQNALDEKATRILMTLEPVAGRPLARLVVEDDAGGFVDLKHAYTAFAPSPKKGDPEKRGRFDLGEKLVLATAVEAIIASTSGTIEFSKDGRRYHYPRRKTERGTRIEALVRMTRDEYERAITEVPVVLLPEGVEVTFNGERILPRRPLVTFEETLPTIIGDDEGVLRNTRRKTIVEVYEPGADEAAMIFELGLPVVETGDRYHINVKQRVPVTLDRENVPPAFLRAVRTAVLNHTAHLLRGDEAKSTWVDDALASDAAEADAVRSVIVERFGKNAVIADPSDPEATNKAMAEGYAVIQGGAFNGAQWKNIRAAGVQPAGRVFPTPKPYDKATPGAPPVPEIDPADWTDGMRGVAALAQRLAERVMGVNLRVRIVRATHETFSMCYGGGELQMNLFRLGHGFFNNWKENLEGVLDILIDEFGHEYESNHLSEQYHRALRRVGAKLTVLGLQDPDAFGVFAPSPYVLCIANDGYEASLERGKVYEIAVNMDGMLQIEDESGETYAYPEDLFIPVRLPEAAVRALR